MYRVLSILVVCAAFAALPKDVAAWTDGDDMSPPCYSCTGDPLAGTAHCASGGSHTGCSVSCSSGLCACATAGTCSMTLRSPDGSISTKVASVILHSGGSDLMTRTVRVDQGRQLIRTCDEAVVLRDYSHAKLVAMRTSTHRLVL